MNPDRPIGLPDYRIYLERKISEVRNDYTLVGEYKRGLLDGYRSAYLTFIRRFEEVRYNNNDRT